MRTGCALLLRKGKVGRAANIKRLDVGGNLVMAAARGERSASESSPPRLGRHPARYIAALFRVPPSEPDVQLFTASGSPVSL